MKYYGETIIHFICDKCNKWWSISDAPIDEKYDWFCPWCGHENNIDSMEEK
jgi:PHP family Zn ribbon phosphoesterase